MSANGFGQFLADKNDYCVECIASEKVNISSKGFSIRLDNARFPINTSNGITLYQEEKSKEVGRQTIASVGVGSKSNVQS